ncbi:tetratricopeptide repeat protein [Tundrisphaera lichenicola]|uniref:tetratricopeptide repeat protein n=1 Tax=Tundrisphaera lichenicola TaxID=2029860 RepID=UPI003EC04CAD
MPADRSLAQESANRGRSPKFLAASLAAALTLLALGIAFWSTSGENPALLRQRANMAAQQGRWEEAEAMLGRLSDPTANDWLLRALVATSLNRPESAIEYLAKIPPDGPWAARVALLTSRAELGRFRARPMEDALHLALRLDPKIAEARRSLLYLYGVQGRRREMLEQFAALAAQGPLDFNLVKNWCIAHQEQVEEPADLKAPLEHFVENDPDDRWSRLGLARVYRRLGLFDRAMECLAPLPDSDPEARAGRAEIEFDRGNQEAVTSLLDGGPADHAKLALLRGQAALNRLDGPAAVQFFRISDAAEPNHSETLYGLAQALRIVGDRDAAEPYARRAAAQRSLRDQLYKLKDKDTDKAVFYCQLAAECESAGYLPVARAWYRLAIADDPLRVQAQEALARLSSAPLKTDASNLSGTN